MTADFRALCAELVKSWEPLDRSLYKIQDWDTTPVGDCIDRLEEVSARARAALAEADRAERGYDELTISDLLVVAYEKAHPENNPSAEQADLIDELIRRLRHLDQWRTRVTASVDPYLTEEDGSDLVSDPDRIRYMLERLSSARVNRAEHKTSFLSHLHSNIHEQN